MKLIKWTLHHNPAGNIRQKTIPEYCFCVFEFPYVDKVKIHSNLCRAITHLKFHFFGGGLLKQVQCSFICSDVGCNQCLKGNSALILCTFDVSDQQKHRMLHIRQEQFKSAALEAKQRQDLRTAQKYLKTFKVSSIQRNSTSKLSK